MQPSHPSQPSDNKIDPAVVELSGGDWGGYGEVSGPLLLQLARQDKLRVMFAGNAILVWLVRPDGIAGVYRLLDQPAVPVPQPVPSGELTSELDHLFQLTELLPLFQKYGQQYSFPYQVIGAICYQESGFRNWKVHLDGTGFGLFGLDDNGLLPEFERWAKMDVGRDGQHKPVSPNKQIEYAAYQLAQYTTLVGDPVLAAQAWHRGLGTYQDELGAHYGALIRSHISRIFS